MSMMNLQADLSSDLIFLRPLKEDDFEELYAIASDSLICEQHPVPNRHEREVYSIFKERVF